MKTNAPKSCSCCGKATHRYGMAGKRTQRHKCPHGNWCVSGHRLQGAHVNPGNDAHRRACPECWGSYWGRVAEDRKTK